MRTDQQKVSMTPVTVSFGDKEYPIKPLVISKSEPWREKLFAHLAQFNSFRFPEKTEDLEKAVNDAIKQALNSYLIQFPSKMLELIFAYAPDLPKNEIMDAATDEQIVLAFANMMEMAFPFFEALRMVTQVAKASQPAMPATTVQ